MPITRKTRPEPMPPLIGESLLIAWGPSPFGSDSAGPRLRVVARDEDGKPTLYGAAYRVAEVTNGDS